MASQQLQYASLISAMKLAMKRRADESDSGDSIHAHTNRGNKLKRKASFVRDGRLDDTGGLSYKKKVNHAGYSRSIIYTNPSLVDSDGEIYSPTSSHANSPTREMTPIEDNPYSEIHLEQLLQPLTGTAELQNHPSLSVAYTNTALTQMAEDALDMARRESRSLAKIKRLQVRLRGDAEWAPCGMFETENDEALLDGEMMEDLGIGSVVTSVQDVETGLTQAEIRPATRAGADTVRKLAGKVNGDAEDGVEAMDMAAETKLETEGMGTANDDRCAEDEGKKGPNGTPSLAVLQNPSLSEIRKSIEPANSENTSVSNGATHSMTTRRKARSPTAPSSLRLVSPTPSDSASVPAIHPWFLPLAPACPDKNLSIPPPEAEETRHLLTLYIHKQELLVRYLTQLSSNLLKADRLRKLVWNSCKASAHLRDDGKGNWVTEMSDGEDWFDVEAASLQPWELNDKGYLEKGKDEIEEPGEEEARRGGRRRRVVGR